MLIKNITIVQFHGDEKNGYNRDGEWYRSRMAEISWPDEDGKRVHRLMARMTTQPCNEMDAREMRVGDAMDADVSFSLSPSKSGYMFSNVYVNKIL